MALRIHGPLGAVLHEAGKLTHFRDPTPPVYPAPQSFGGYLRATAESFDPRTPSGALNLAATLGGGKLPHYLRTPADLPTVLGKAGIQPSSRTRPDPGVPRDPDSASNWFSQVGSRADAPSYVSHAIGPRRVGGIYRNAYWNEVYRVLDIQKGPGKTGSQLWQIKVEPLNPTGPYNVGPRWHSTAWTYGKDQVLQQPSGSTGGASTYMGHLLETRYNPKIHKPGGG